jgi:hypothetical protein
LIMIVMLLVTPIWSLNRRRAWWRATLRAAPLFVGINVDVERRCDSVETYRFALPERILANVSKL